MFDTNIIANYLEIANLIKELLLPFLFTKPQIAHVTEFIAAATQSGFKGKVSNVIELSHSPKHRTSFGSFLAKGCWSEEQVLRAIQKYVIKIIWNISITTGKPINVIIDDTTSTKTQPSSKAKKPIEKCGYHKSHLEKKMVYGHQVVAVYLECNGVRLPYMLVMYEKDNMSKIKIAVEAVLGLPRPANKGYVMADSWYSCKELIDASLARGYNYIGGLKTNRIIYPPKARLGEQIQGFAKKLSREDVHLVKVGKNEYWVYRYDGRLNGIDKATVILCWPKDKLFVEKDLNAFICTEEGVETQDILEHYMERWPIEVFFRHNKMYLGLDKYQVRSEKAIKRFWILVILAYIYCCQSGTEQPFCSFGEGLRSARKEVQRDKYRWVYEQAVSGNSFDDICKALKIA